MKMPKKVETAWKQVDRRAKDFYGMTREEYLDAFFNRFGQHDDLKTELAIERIMLEEHDLVLAEME